MRSYSFETPIINVGNLSTGGTGKSPHTEYLIRLLKDQYEVATLSRGYGRSKSGFHIVTDKSTVRDCGDEPLQFKSKFPDVHVTVDAKRVTGAIQIFSEFPETDVILLDDAYQHRAIEPSLNILLTRYHDPYFKDFVLPTGNLREWRNGSKRADIIVVTKCPDDLTKENREAVLDRIRPELHQTVYFSKLKYGAIRPVFEGNTYNSLEELKGKELVLVTGIANTQSLQKKLEKQGLKYEHVKFGDHHRFKPTDIEKIRNLFDNLAGDKIVLTTEKDAQRLRSIEAAQKLPFYYIEIEVELIEDATEFDREILKHVKRHQSDSTTPD